MSQPSEPVINASQSSSKQEWVQWEGQVWISPNQQMISTAEGAAGSHFKINRLKLNLQEVYTPATSLKYFSFD